MVCTQPCTPPAECLHAPLTFPQMPLYTEAGLLCLHHILTFDQVWTFFTRGKEIRKKKIRNKEVSIFTFETQSNFPTVGSNKNSISFIKWIVLWLQTSLSAVVMTKSRSKWRRLLCVIVSTVSAFPSLFTCTVALWSVCAQLLVRPDCWRIQIFSMLSFTKFTTKLLPFPLSWHWTPVLLAEAQVVNMSDRSLFRRWVREMLKSNTYI